MVERKLLADEETVTYEGLFNFAELYNTVNEYTSLKGYDRLEALNQEVVNPGGKDILIILQPNKVHSDYVKKVLKIEMRVSGLKEIETEIDKVKVRLNQGKITILYSAYLETDYEGKWEQKPIYYFFRTMYDKFIYRQHTHDFEVEILSDLRELKEKVGSYLNLYRYKKAI